MPSVSEEELAIGPIELLEKDPLILSSPMGTVQEMRELIDLAADGRVKTHVGRAGWLSELAGILGELETGA